MPMKNIKLNIVTLLLVFFISSGFISWNREEETKKLNPATVIMADKCFINFMKGMNELAAVYNIPDSKLEKGKELVWVRDLSQMVFAANKELLIYVTTLKPIL